MPPSLYYSQTFRGGISKPCTQAWWKCRASLVDYWWLTATRERTLLIAACTNRAPLERCYLEPAQYVASLLTWGTNHAAFENRTGRSQRGEHVIVVTNNLRCFVTSVDGVICQCSLLRRGGAHPIPYDYTTRCSGTFATQNRAVFLDAVYLMFIYILYCFCTIND